MAAAQETMKWKISSVMVGLLVARKSEGDRLTITMTHEAFLARKRRRHRVHVRSIFKGHAT